MSLSADAHGPWSRQGIHVVGAAMTSGDLRATRVPERRGSQEGKNHEPAASHGESQKGQCTSARSVLPAQLALVKATASSGVAHTRLEMGSGLTR